MNDLQTVESLVYRILMIDPQTRNSDNYLFFKVCMHFLQQQGINIYELSFSALFLHLKQYGIPQFETVGRCRRKIQEKNPDLRGNRQVTEQRSENEEIFRDYMKG